MEGRVILDGIRHAFSRVLEDVREVRSHRVSIFFNVYIYFLILQSIGKL